MLKKPTWGGWAKNQSAKQVKKHMTTIARNRMNALTPKEKKAIGKRLALARAAARLAKKKNA